MDMSGIIGTKIVCGSSRMSYYMDMELKDMFVFDFG
jgi:hypothetical protein